MLTLEYLKDKAEQLQKVTGYLLCIAGGAPRDILNDRPVKDIDVFIAVDDSFTVDEVLTLFKEELEISCEKISGRPEASDSENPVYETEWEGHKWQFIFKFNPWPSLASFAESLLDDFDYTFCQVAVVPYQKELYTCTEAFEIAIVHKQINRNRLPLDLYRTDKAKARLKRLQDKYPEYTVEPLPEPIPLRGRDRDEDDLIRRIREAQQQMMNAPAPEPMRAVWLEEFAPIPNQRIRTHWIVRT